MAGIGEVAKGRHPPRADRKGIVRSMRIWADLDLLLTASSITEAHQLTKAERRMIAVTPIRVR